MKKAAPKKVAKKVVKKAVAKKGGKEPVTNVGRSAQSFTSKFFTSENWAVQASAPPPHHRRPSRYRQPSARKCALLG